jgi:GNAT superfamily N-acetyltransferase
MPGSTRTSPSPTTGKLFYTRSSSAPGSDPQRLWMLVTSGTRPVGLLIAAVHCDSPLFRHRHWVEVQALYVADSHRRLGIGRRLLAHAYAWAERRNLPRIQLYVTASNVRARSVYEEEGFAVTQAIMRKGL